MMQVFHKVLAWSEVWALLIPLAFMLKYKQGPDYMKPVRMYIWLALVINFAIVIIYHYKYPWHFPDWLMSNNFLYNLHSSVRLILFALFFIKLGQSLQTIRKLVLAACVIFMLINFIFFEDFFAYYSFSNRLLSVEVCVMLLYCMHYYFVILTDETHEERRPPSFWVVTGLSIYTVINFPIFLFYMALLKQFEHFAVSVWDISNISYIIFCLLLAKAFYECGKRTTQFSNH